MASIGIAYTSQSGTTYNVVFEEFTGKEFARTYDPSAQFQRTASGTTSLSGFGSRQKFIWAVNSHLTEAKAQEINALFRSWDNDRAMGQTAACGLIDDTLFGRTEASVIISTPPSFRYVAPNRIEVSMGMTEV